MGNRRMVAVLVAAAAGPVMAVPVTFGSAASLNNLQSQLIDLAPDDGIAPSARLVSFSLIVETHLFGDRSRRTIKDVKFGTTAITQSALFRDSASASATLSVLGNPISSFVDGVASRNGGRFDAYASSARFVFTYELAPHTALQWTGGYSISAWAQPNANAKPTDKSTATVWFGHVGSSNGVAAYANQGVAGAFSQRTGTDIYGIGNDTDVAIRQNGVFGAIVTGGNIGKYWEPTPASVSPVPEPSTYALMFAGLGVVGAAARRRSRAA